VPRFTRADYSDQSCFVIVEGERKVPMPRLTSRFVALEGAQDDVPTLGRIVFGTTSGRPTIEGGVPTLRMRMSGDFVECWETSGLVHTGRFHDLVYAHNDEFLFCAGYIPASGHYTDATREAYSHAFALLRELEFPKLFRMWNFIPQINGENHEGLEVYRDFCRGRALAFEHDNAARFGMPAATGIGTWGDGVGFYFLACRDSDIGHIENTRQTPAYDYPRRYGPKSPSFARATVLRGANDTLFVSGTASILGHETVHIGNLDAQFEVTTGNIAHLISRENVSAQGEAGGFTLADLDQIKVYYRHADDLPRVMQLSRNAFDARASIRFLNVDICRDDLLVEIEGIACARRYSNAF
jgi:chorismate lyase / 3-hydroxybenzoate synthase